MRRDPDAHEFFALVMTAILVTALGLAVLSRTTERPGLSSIIAAREL